MKLETHRIEYKLQLTPELDLEKDVIAFLNSREGGTIYVGVIEHFKFLTEHGTEHLTEHATEQVVKLIKIIIGEHSREELMRLLNLNHREYFRKEYLQKAIELNLVEPTLPDKPKSIKQNYRLTPKGRKLKESLENERI